MSPHTRTHTADPKPLLKLVFAQFLGAATGFTDMVARFIPSPVAAAPARVDHIYSGPLAGPTVAAMRACDPAGPLMINVVKVRVCLHGWLLLWICCSYCVAVFAFVAFRRGVELTTFDCVSAPLLFSVPLA